MDRSSTIDIIFRAIDKTGNTIDGLWGGLQKVSRIGFGAAVAGLAAVGVGVAALGYGIEHTTTLAREQIRVENQLDAVLESTGHAAGLSADHLKKYASELQSVTNYSDETIISAENMLLTFTNIQGDIYDRTLPLILDLSAAMGQDLKTSAIQVGKALNDPVAGLSALARVGIQFSDAQKAQIEQMVQVNDIVGAQGIILDELGRQFGGSAKAQADPLIQLQNLWGDFQEEIGKGALPILNDLASRAMPWVTDGLEKIKTKIQEVAPTFGSAFSNLLDGNQEAALQDLQKGLLQLGFSPDQVAEISESAVNIGESLDRVWQSVKQIDPESIFSVIEGIVKIVEGIAWAGEKISDAIEMAKNLADLYSQVEKKTSGTGFRGVQAIGEAISAENRGNAPAPSAVGGNDAAAMMNLMQGFNVTVQPQPVQITVDGKVLGETMATYTQQNQESHRAVPFSDL